MDEIVRNLKETAQGLDQWNPADLKLLSKEACESLAAFLNLIEGGAPWPKQMTVARVAFLAKEEDSDMDPLEYRVLLMLSTVYRVWGKIRLPQLQPWIATWDMQGIYVGVEGKGGQ